MTTQPPPIVVQLSLEAEVRQRLLEHAARQGRGVDALVTDLVEQAMNSSKNNLEHALASLRRDVLSSGMTEDELGEFFATELEQARRERRSPGS